MTKPLGRGLLQSLRTRVDHDVRDLVRENKILRRSRYGLGRRFLRVWLVDQTVVSLLASYLVCMLALLGVEAGIHSYLPGLLRGDENVDFTKDLAGFFLTAQVGVLAVLTVAIAVVTLLTQKDDGSSMNSDVRLYYFESYSYELAASGILLSCALVAQLFWPIQPLVALIGGDAGINHFKVCVTSIHGAWLVLNLYLLLHFINTTLRFVESRSRAALRRQYSASEIIPHDVKRRLLAVYFGNAPVQIIGAEELKAGPLVSFGMGMTSAENATSEISRDFATPSRLVDVWLLPLGFALRRWHTRARTLKQPAWRFGDTHWDGHLAVMTDFNTVHEEKLDFVLREGGVALTRLERFLIGLSFRFAKVDPREASLPRPTDIIEQLVSKVVAQIEAGLPNGFDDALKETAEYHSFALEAQNWQDESGGRVNLAEVADGLFRNPEFDWIREYRRAYTAATNKMTADGWFTHGMNSLVVRLWPRDPTEFPPKVLTNILELGRIQVTTFEAWVTKRAVVATPDGDAAPDLAGSDLRAYEDALVHFVSSWETLQQVIISSFEIRQAARDGDDVYWRTAGASWPALQTHMRNEAYYLAAAVWNEDLTGIDRFRDLLVRWTQVFYAQLQDVYAFRDALMLTPDLFSASWPDAQTTAVRTLIYPQAPVSAKSVFGLILREAHLDAIAITGAILLHWFATRQQPSQATAQTALLTLRREPLPGGGSTLLDQTSTQKSVFRLVFDLLIREALHSPFEETTYSGYLDGLIHLLNGMATPRMIPGRIYGGFALDGFQTLTPEFLAILAGNLPEQGDLGVAELVQRLLGDHPQFQIDRTLRDFEYQFRRYASALNGDPDARFTATVECFVDDPDLGALRLRLRAIFEGVGTAISEFRLARIREAPLDETRVNGVRTTVEQALLGNPRPMGGFPPVAVERSDEAVEVRDTDWGVMDRGSFTRPEMAGVSFDELPPMFAQMTADYLRNIGWYELRRQPKSIEEFDSALGVAALLRRVVEITEDSELGEELTLFVPNNEFGHPIHMTTAGFPSHGLEAFEFIREEGAEGGVGAAYAGTLGNIRIYIWQFADAAVLCSRTLLRAVRFGRIRDLDRIFDFELFDTGDPTKSRVRIWLAPLFEWEDRPHIQMTFVNLEPEPVEVWGENDAMEDIVTETGGDEP